jgi:hypothetical protein
VSATDIHHPAYSQSFLLNWWTTHYKRPLKDPILLSYTFEELVYEYMSLTAFERAKEAEIEQESDKIEQENWDAAEAWADSMEEEGNLETAPDPMQNPENIDWMEKQLLLDREQFGEDFGGDVELNFEED